MKVKVLSLILSLVLITGTGLVMAGCAEEEEVALPIVLAFDASASPKFPMCQSYSTYWDEMEKRAGGDIKMEYYWYGVLGKKESQYYRILQNVAQVACITPSYTAGLFPLTTVGGLPFAGVTSGSHGTYALDAVREEYLEAEYPGVKLLSVCTQGPYNLFTKFPVRTAEDLVGKKLTVSAGFQQEIAKALGIVPVSVPMGEWYNAVATGLVEGSLTIVQPVMDFKIYETIDYVTIIDATWVPYAYIMSLEAWNSLPPDTQKVIEDGAMYGAQITGSLYDPLNAKGLAFMADYGIEITNLAPDELARWKQVCAPIAGEWIESMEALGLPGQSIVDAFKASVAATAPK